MAGDNLNDRISKDELLDERQLDNVVGGFNSGTQLDAAVLDKIRQQFNQAIFGNSIQQRPN